MEIVRDAVNGDHYRIEFEGAITIWPAWCTSQDVDDVVTEWTRMAQVCRAQGVTFRTGMSKIAGILGLPHILRGTTYANLEVDGAVVDVPSVVLSPAMMGCKEVEGYQGKVYGNHLYITVCGRAQQNVIITTAANLPTAIEDAMRQVVAKEQEARQRRARIDVKPIARLIMSRLDPAVRSTVQDWISRSHREMLDLEKDKDTHTVDVRTLAVEGVRSAKLVMTDRCKVNGTMNLGAAQIHEDGINARMTLATTVCAGLADQPARRVVDHEVLDGRVIDTVFSQGNGMTTVRLRKPGAKYMPLAA